MKRIAPRLPNPGKSAWFAIGTAAGVVIGLGSLAGYVFWKMTKM